MEKRSQTKVAMSYGLMYGLASSIISLIFYFLGVDMQSKMPGLVTYIVLIIVLVYGLKSYRDQDLGGFISYGKSLGTGTLIGLFGGILVGVYTILFFTVIAPDMAQTILEKAQEKMLEKGAPENQVETGMKITRFMMQTPVLFALSIFGTTFMSFIFSLIISAFVKRDRTPFDQPVDVLDQPM